VFKIKQILSHLACVLVIATITACDAPDVEAPDWDAPPPLAKSPPNVIVILADDIGIETVGVYGSEYATPRIDSIAANGMRFDAAHATPICTPSRVRLLTGRFNYKNYVDFAVLDPAETSMGQLMQEAGYRTLVAGKWQLSGTGDDDDPPGTLPQDAGFEEHMVWYLNRESKGSRYWEPRLFDNGESREFPETDYGPGIVNERVRQFITRDDARPFFIYYPMMLAHKAWVTTPVSLGAESDKDRFTGMMAYMDLMVGQVLDTLEESGLSNDTLIFFIGDNGTHPDITSLRNGIPVQGGKWNSNDSGTHVPFMAQWPGTIPAGTSSQSLVDLMDVLPTTLEAADATVPGTLDGYSLYPEMTGAEKSDRSWIFMHFDPHQDAEESLTTPSRFVFDNEWKLYGDGRFFDLDADLAESVALDTSGFADTANTAPDAVAFRRLSGVLGQLGRRPFFHELADSETAAEE
jgi:arylsulfatase A